MKKENKPQACPDKEDIWKAIEILDDQWLHFYQLLFFKHLTNPYGYPFTVERHPSLSGRGGLTTGIDIYPKEHPDFKFTVFDDKDDETVHKNIELIQNAIGKEKVSEHACCPLATHRQCVCVASFECPIHGVTCIGSHD